MNADEARRKLVLDLGRVAVGDRTALHAVYEATSAKLFGVVLRILNDRSEAEDVLQDVYITIWTKAGAFDPSRASPITWLASLARNRAIDRQRQIGRRTPRPISDAGEVVDGAESALDSVMKAENAKRLQDCMGNLETHQAEALRIAFFEGATYAEVARAFDMPTSTMKSWIRRSLIKLKACLSK